MKTIDLIKALERLNKPFYTLSDLEKITGLTRTILYITLNRLTGKGILEKMAPGIYRVFTSPARIEKIAASLYLPNYLSFESMLSRYGILTLVPYTLTFATTRKTKKITVGGRDVVFRQIKKDLFWGYEMAGGIYIAKPEKAFLDLAYFASRGKSFMDLDEIDVKKLSKPKIVEFLEKFPEYTKRYVSKSIYKL